ncbi:unnamed protein product, partial [Amoebophrya sp. A25]|eukprot:GSA25T00011852001.1
MDFFHEMLFEETPGETPPPGEMLYTTHLAEDDPLRERAPKSLVTFTLFPFFN